MTRFKNIRTIVCLVVFSIGFLPHSLLSKKREPWQGPVEKALLKEAIKSYKALSSSDVSRLSTALASTSASAGNNALLVLSDIASSQTNLINAFFNICVGLTTPDSTHANATPISLATATVRKALSTEVISTVNDSYNFTLLHFATLFATFGGSIDSSINTRTIANTIISTILSSLTQSEILAALTAQDMWGSTPLHYAALSPTASQSTVTSALLSSLSDVSNRITVISTQNTWRYTPVHYAATYAISSTNLINSLFLGSTATQKIAALSIQDQWLATPLHYAALFNNTAIINKTVMLGLSKSQKSAALNIKSFWNFTVTDYANYDAAKASLFDPMLNTMTATDLKTTLTIAVPTPKFEITTIIVPTFLLAQ